MTLAKWAKAVKERDGNKCKVCGSTENLNSHHIETKAGVPELATDVDNGITLCRVCHRIAHKGVFYEGYGILQDRHLFTEENIKRVEQAIKDFQEEIIREKIQ